MYVEWNIDIAPRDSEYGGIVDDYNGPLWKKCSGEVVGTVKTVFGTISFIVALPNGKFDEVYISDCKQLSG